MTSVNFDINYAQTLDKRTENGTLLRTAKQNAPSTNVGYSEYVDKVTAKAQIAEVKANINNSTSLPYPDTQELEDRNKFRNSYKVNSFSLGYVGCDLFLLNKTVISTSKYKDENENITALYSGEQ